MKPEIEQRIADLECEKSKLTNRITELEASERETFAAGWDAFFAQHNGLIISHGLTDIRSGFEEAWQAYWQAKGQG